MAVQECDQTGAESGGAVAFPSEWRVFARRLRWFPPADQRSFRYPLAIKGSISQYPPERAQFSGWVSGRAPAGDRWWGFRREFGGIWAANPVCDVMVTLVRAVCTHRMRPGG
jgi:hypothetical protein